MTQVQTPQHVHRPLWKRPVLWFIALAVLLVFVVFAVIEQAGKPATVPYSTFLDQLDANNVADVTFAGTQIDGHFKQPVRITGANDGASLTSFRSRVPGFGDPTLLVELHKEHVPFGVASSSWLGVGGATLLGVIGAALLAKPMLLVIAAAFIAGLFKMARGGKMDARAILSKFPMFRSMSTQSSQQKPTHNPAGPSTSLEEVEMTSGTHHHSKRPWYGRPPIWVLGVVLLALAAFGIVELIDRPTVTPYSAFLDQLDAKNVASVTIAGTQIDGTFKQRVGAATENAAPQSTFRTQVPDFGDPTLLPELRKQRVVINVVSSSGWVSWLGRIPLPMVLIVGGLLIAGLVRLIRGGKASTGSPMPVHPMMGMISGLFGKPEQPGNPPPRDGNPPKSG